MHIALDPGHGGTDPGAVAGGVRGAAVALDYALELRGELVGRGAQVTLTREADRFVTLAERCRAANEARADAYVSLHCNASASDAAEGLQVFHCRGSAGGQALAAAIYEAVTEIGPPGRSAGVFPDESPQCGGRPLYVLRGTHMPAVLVELGFLTCPGERSRLIDPDRRGRIAQAIAAALVEWRDRSDPNRHGDGGAQR